MGCGCTSSFNRSSSTPRQGTKVLNKDINKNKPNKNGATRRIVRRRH